MRKKLLALSLALCATGTLFAGCGGNADLEKQLQELQGKLDQAIEKNEELEQENKDLQDSFNELEQENKDLQDSFNELEQENKDLQDEIEELRGQASANQQISYTVKHFFEELDGSFKENTKLRENKIGLSGSTVEANAVEETGFTFDEENVSNRMSAELSVTGENALAVYYKRNRYLLNVIGGEAEAETALYGQTVALSPTFSYTGLSWSVEGEGASVNKNVLTVGDGDVTVVAEYKSEMLLEENICLKAENSAASVDLYVSDIAVQQGVTFLHSVLGGTESYYAFMTGDSGASLYYVNGDSKKLLKNKQLEGFESGVHTYSVSTLGGSVICTLDGEQVLNYSAADASFDGFTTITAFGRFGVLTEGEKLSPIAFRAEKGVLSLGYIKKECIRLATEVEVFAPQINWANWFIENATVTVDVLTAPHFTDAHNFVAAVEACKDVKSVMSLVKNLGGDYYTRLKKEGYSVAMHKIVEDLTDGFLRPIVGDSMEVHNTLADCKVSIDTYARDPRMFIPDAYTLYGRTTAQKGLMEYFREELSRQTTDKEMLEICTKYANEIGRVTLYRNLEFYYWWLDEQGYNVYNPWWYLYDYAGTSNLTYTGCIDGYVWNDQFRLMSALFNSSGAGYSDPSNWGGVFSMYRWKQEYHMLYPRDSKVSFNLNGGTIVGETEVDYIKNSSNPQNYTLPTPTKTGATFAGWYTNSSFLGEPVTQIGFETFFDDYTFYAKWTNDANAPVIQVSTLFGENMVMPRNKNVNVFGTGKDGEKVTVSFKGQTKETTVENGEWSVSLEPMKEDVVGATMTVTASNVHYTFRNILVGEVWLASGQSNMEMRLGHLRANRLGDYGTFNNYDKIRVYRQQVPNFPEDPDLSYANHWAMPENHHKATSLYGFSAIGVGFALRLQQILGPNVPVGVVESSRGGTLIEEWMSQESLQKVGSSVPVADKHIESRYYNGMTLLLKDFALSGVVWYQGCSNASYSELYVSQFEELCNTWRTQFGNEELPVVVTQLVQFGLMDFRDFRLMQWELMNEVENVYTVSGIDFGEENDIHPHDKYPLAVRLADVAAKYVYGVEGVNGLSAYPVSIESKDGKLVISFSDAENGFMEAYEIKGFEVQNANGEWVKCDAEIVDKTIVLSGFDFEVMAVRYLYECYIGELDLFTTNGLPVAPFLWVVAE